MFSTTIVAVESVSHRKACSKVGLNVRGDLLLMPPVSVQSGQRVLLERLLEALWCRVLGGDARLFLLGSS